MNTNRLNQRRWRECHVPQHAQRRVRQAIGADGRGRYDLASASGNRPSESATGIDREIFGSTLQLLAGKQIRQLAGIANQYTPMKSRLPISTPLWRRMS